MLRVIFWAWLAAAVGCTFQPSPVTGVDGDEGPELDAAGGEASCADWKASGFDPCAYTAEVSLAIEAPTRYDTRTDELGGLPPPFISALIAGTPDLRIVPLRDLRLPAGGRLEVIGDAALVLAVYGDATIEGELDASGGLDPLWLAPGADQCADGGEGALGTSDGTGGGGGGGGGFATPGGAGGHGDDVLADGGAGGGVEGTPILIPLRGGCAGGQGGTGGALATAGAPGRGGGAVQLAVRGRLSVSGAIRAVGSGGHGGRNVGDGIAGGGGGGGGSGGAIVLEATTLEILAGATICANGGAGGEGGDDDESGGDGAAGSCSEVDVALSSSVAENGGDGGRGTSKGFPSPGLGMPTFSFNAAGGGGGGGLGRVRIEAYRGEPAVDEDAEVSGGEP